MDVFLSPPALAMVRVADRQWPSEAVLAWLDAGLDADLPPRRRGKSLLDAKTIESVPAANVIATLQSRRALLPLKKVSVLLDPALVVRLRTHFSGRVGPAVGRAIEHAVSRLSTQEKLRIAHPPLRRRKPSSEIKSAGVRLVMTKAQERRFARAAFVAGRPISTLIRELALEGLAARDRAASRAARKAA